MFETQLQEILEDFVKQDPIATKKFKLYLDTVLYNMPTKVEKYKPSLYFDNDQIKEIEHQGYLIPFYIDNHKNYYVLLGIVKKQ